MDTDAFEREPIEPLVKELQQSGDEITFHFTQGTIPAPPPPEFNTFFGNPPHWRYICVGEETPMEALEKHRNFVEQENPEQSIRNGERPIEESTRSIKNAMTQLRNTMNESGPFQGVIGYSEGAAMAATLLVEELQEADRTGVPSTLKCGIFMAGAPAFRPAVGGWYLWDEVGEVINVPTCHVIGVSDPYIHCALALHDTCDSEKAIIFDHGWGHTIPRDAEMVQELAITIREMIADANVLDMDSKI